MKTNLCLLISLSLVYLATGAPNGTTRARGSGRSFFPGSENVPKTLEVTKTDKEPYVAESTDFFPSSASAGLKFPQSEEKMNSMESEANEAIDVILKSARTGKSLNLRQDDAEGEELAKVASDPHIQEQLAAGNEAEARGYIRNKLCSLGLMPVSSYKRIFLLVDIIWLFGLIVTLFNYEYLPFFTFVEVFSLIPNAFHI